MTPKEQYELMERERDGTFPKNMQDLCAFLALAMDRAVATRVKLYCLPHMNPFPQMRDEVRQAAQLIIGASPWLTDSKLLGALVAASAEQKFLILNPKELKRLPGCTPMIGWRDGRSEWQGPGRLWCVAPVDPLIHYKVLLADGVTWIGSANFTEASTERGEFVVRIEDVAFAQQAREWLFITAVGPTRWARAKAGAA